MRNKQYPSYWSILCQFFFFCTVGCCLIRLAQLSCNLFIFVNLQRLFGTVMRECVRRFSLFISSRLSKSILLPHSLLSSRLPLDAPIKQRYLYSPHWLRVFKQVLFQPPVEGHETKELSSSSADLMPLSHNFLTSLSAWSKSRFCYHP